MCLWCTWTSETARRDFEVAIPRARRASAPQSVGWKRTPIKPEDSRPPMGSALLPDSRKSETRCSRDRRSEDDGVSKTSSGGTLPIATGDHSGANKNTKSSAQRKPCHHISLGADSDDDTTNVSRHVATATPAVGNPLKHAPKSDSLIILSLQRSVSVRSNHRGLRQQVEGSSSIENPFSPSPPLFLASGPQSVDRSSSYSMDDMTKYTTNSSPIFIDFKTDDTHAALEVNKMLFIPPSSPVTRGHSSPQRTLRRKKHIPIFRASSPPCPSFPSEPISISLATPQRPQSHSDLKFVSPPTYLPLSLPLPASTPMNHTRSHSQPANAICKPVRLGHPSRPYYSAIRENMSRPTSLVEYSHSRSLSSSSITSRPLTILAPSPSLRSASPLPGIFTHLPPSSFLDSPFDEDEDETSECSRPRLARSSCPPSRTPRAASPGMGLGLGLGFSFSHTPAKSTLVPSLGFRSGFSMSGETELRMALAMEHGGDDRDGYKFRDMGKGHHRHGLMERVKKLRRGLKHLVSGKS